MYQHPATFELMANSRRDDFLREAQNARLVRQAQGHEAGERSDVQHRLAAAAVTVLLALGVLAVF